MTAMTTAERRGYQQICDENGCIMVIAADQRGSMRTLLTADPEEQKKIDNNVLANIKADITRYLASSAACILVDPVCAVPGLVDKGILPRNTALLVGMDASGWDLSPEGYRISKMVEGVTARRVRELGATGAKIMIYLRTDHEAANARNLETLKAAIEDFGREDLLLVVEFLTYQLKGESKEVYEANFPALIQNGARACLQAGSKVLKIPYPGSEEACAAVTKMTGGVPWAVLSAGVDHDTFLRQVEAAMRNGASGVIAGRSLWKDCISLDPAVSKERLSTIGLSRLREIQEIVKLYHGQKTAA